MWLILYMEINPPFFYLTLTSYKKAQLTKLYRNLLIYLHLYFIFFIKKKKKNKLRISLICVSGNSKTVLRLIKKNPYVGVNWFCCDGVIVGWQDNSDFNGLIRGAHGSG